MHDSIYWQMQCIFIWRDCDNGELSVSRWRKTLDTKSPNFAVTLPLLSWEQSIVWTCKNQILYFKNCSVTSTFLFGGGGGVFP